MTKEILEAADVREQQNRTNKKKVHELQKSRKIDVRS